MQKMISFYTLAYICLIFCASLLKIIPGISILREGYILFLILSLFIYLKSITVNTKTLVLLIYICCNAISYKISQNHNDSLNSFILYISGPMIFVLLTCLPLKEKTVVDLEKKIEYLLVFFIIIALLIFPIQKQFYSIFGLNKGKNFINLYRFTAGGSINPRLSGLCAHPTSMGAICLFIFVNRVILRKNKKSLWILIPYYLSNTRSILMGTPFVWYTFLPLKKKIWVTLLVPSFVILSIFVLLHSVLDPSALVHFADLLENGPKLLFGNLTLFGYGHGTMSPFTSESSFIHVESDLYIALMQIGIIGVAVYLFIMIMFLRVLRKDNTVESKYCATILICINIGCIFLSYYIVRFLSNYMWIELGLYFSYRRNICQK